MREGIPIRIRGITKADDAREAIRVAATLQGIHMFYVYINCKPVIMDKCPDHVKDYDVVEIIELWEST